MSKDLPQLVAELEAANTEFAEADRLYTQIAHRRGTALTRVSEAQNAIDEALAALKKSPPWGSRWSGNRVR